MESSLKKRNHIKSHLDCKWYIEHGKCKMPSINNKFSTCISMDELDPFCEWLIDFLNSDNEIDTSDVELPDILKLEYNNDKTMEQFMQILSFLM